MNARPGNPIRRRLGRRGLSLIEILVASALLSIIMIGLMAMFGQTQRAYQGSIRQVDVLEGSRAVLDQLGRDFTRISVPADPTVTNLFARPTPGVLPLNLAIAGEPAAQLKEVYFLSGEYHLWELIGYRVASPLLDSGVGTLYRVTADVDLLNLSPAINALIGLLPGPLVPLNPDNPIHQRMQRIADGVVHFQVWPYDAEGHLLGGNLSFLSFSTNGLPAYLELEIAVAEPQLMARVLQAPNAGIRRSLLTDNRHQIHLFRQQIPIRTAPNP